MKFQAVIFDLFGTLVDDFVTSVGQMHTDFAAALEIPSEQLMPLWRQISEMRTIGVFQTVEASIEYVCRIIGVQATAEQMTKAVEIRLRYTKRALEPRPNAIATLRQLKSAGYKIGLISNCSIEIPILWPETEFADLVESPIFSSREHVKKPDPRIYHLASERLAVIPEHCLYIADGENHELAAAGKLGLHSVLLRNLSRDNSAELLREAREWQGSTVCTLLELLELVGV
jgi:putative hydrolase of the HAD superfamily